MKMQKDLWDFVIVGAGMAGASTAWQLVQSGGDTPPSVLVLERESQPGYHTTGRSAALFEEHFGPAQVQALTRASRAFYDAPPVGFADAPILTPRGVLYVGTAEQKELVDQIYAAAIVHATSVSALHDLLTEAAAQDKSELVVSVEYFDRQEQQVRQTVAQVRQEITQVTGREPAAWEVNFYPTDTNPGIIEIILRSGAKN